VCEPVST